MGAPRRAQREQPRASRRKGDRPELRALAPAIAPDRRNPGAGLRRERTAGFGRSRL